MKKLGVILVIAVVVFGCVLAAGCTNSASTSTTSSTTSLDNPALTIDVTKTGSAYYNIGDTFTVTLPSNPSTGFTWKDYSSELGDGLTVTEKSIASTSTALGSAGAQSFTFTATKEGAHIILLEYQKGDEDPIYVYGDLMGVQKTDDEHTDCEFTYAGDYTPQVGQVVLITANGNPTTGYELEVAEDSGLKILKTDYVENTTGGAVGAGGTYKWYVTADQPNMYMFTVNEKDARDQSTSVKFYVPITFVVEA